MMIMTTTAAMRKRHDDHGDNDDDENDEIDDVNNDDVVDVNDVDGDGPQLVHRQGKDVGKLINRD